MIALTHHAIQRLHERYPWCDVEHECCEADRLYRIACNISKSAVVTTGNGVQFVIADCTVVTVLPKTTRTRQCNANRAQRCSTIYVQEYQSGLDAVKAQQRASNAK